MSRILFNAFDTSAILTSILESTSASDLISNTLTTSITLLESTTASDSSLVSFPLSILESISATDNPTATFTTSISVLEATTATDYNSTGGISASILESTSASETLSYIYSAIAVVTESASAIDIYSISLAPIFFNESISVLDTITALLTARAAVTEAITIIDTTNIILNIRVHGNLTQKKTAVSGIIKEKFTSTISLTQKKQSLSITAKEVFKLIPTLKSKKTSIAIQAKETFYIHSQLKSSKTSIGIIAKNGNSKYPKSNLIEKKQSLSISAFTGKKKLNSAIESYTDSIYTHITRTDGINLISNYTDAMLTSVTHRLSTNTKKYYLYDRSQYNDTNLANSNKLISISIHPTRPKTVLIYSNANYSDSTTKKTTSTGLRVINLFISTNSTYRG